MNINLKDFSTSIPKNDATQIIKIYPNPTSDNITIKSSMGLPVMYKIYSLTGKIITEGILQGEITIDVKNSAKGIYFVQFNDTNGILLECRKFIVE